MCGFANTWFDLLGSKKRQKIIVGILYRHPQSCKNEFWQLCTEMKKNAKYNCGYYVLGDININLLNVPNDDRTQQRVNTPYSLAGYHVLNKPTGTIKETESCIDHIMFKHMV